MIEIKDKKNCCGCTACMSACPKNAISMVPDNEGFLYPKIDKKKCINCGICNKVCPIINKKEENNKKIFSYALRTRDNDILKNSTSGGFFTPLAKYILNNQGIVFGVGYGESFEIKHKEATTEDEIKEFRGSKYIQSNLGKSFNTIKKYLDEKKLVLFTGTPCQVEGLKKYLRKEYDNLITMDVVCHGTPSQLLWEKYKEYQTNKYKSDFDKVFFRNKTYGYHAGSMKIVFKNGKEYYGSARVDLLLKSFFKEISSRPSCYNCKFKNLNHCSDFTVFDCWHASDVVNNLKDDDKGYTNLLINSENGYKIFDLIKEQYNYYPVDINKIVELDGRMIKNSVKPHKDRDNFYNILNECGLEKTVEKYIPISKKDKIIEKMKKTIYKVGLIKVAKKIKNKTK